MSREELLKKEILNQFKSLRQFAKAVGIAPSTLTTILNNGIGGTSIDTMIAICDKLHLDVNFFGVEQKPLNNCFVTEDEKKLLDKYRRLDKTAKATVDNVLNFEYGQSVIRASKKAVDTIMQYRMSYFPEPVSAGTGQYLDYTSLQTLTINTTPPIGADFILRVIGDSMEPEYPDGGLVFVRIQKTVEIGDVGIFFSEGNVFMKVRGEDGLESLNKKYPDIKGNKDIKCIGKVVGKLSWSNVVE